MFSKMLDGNKVKKRAIMDYNKSSQKGNIHGALRATLLSSSSMDTEQTRHIFQC